jgi:hypothetical protein
MNDVACRKRFRQDRHRPHSGIVDKVSVSRLGLPENDLLRLHAQSEVSKI